MAGKVGTQMRERMRDVKRRVLEIARASRDISQKSKQKRVAAYGKLLDITSRVVGQAKKFSARDRSECWVAIREPWARSSGKIVSPIRSARAR